MAPLTLAKLADHQIWVSWRRETRDGRITKVPYCPRTGARAASDSPATWTTHDEAALWSETKNGDGVGLMFCQVGDASLAGIDLDTCRDKVTGDIAPWAQEVVDRFDTYSEVSPSRSGVKLFFTTANDDATAIAALFDGKQGRSFKNGAGGDHPPAIEVYCGKRYFIVTNEAIGPTDELRRVSVADLEWLIKEVGPKFAGEGKRNGEDTSRSAKAFRAGAMLKAAGKSYDTMRDALLVHEDADIADWTRTKGLDNGERELRRIYNKTPRVESKEPDVLIWYGDSPPTPPSYLVDETLPEIGVAILGGQFGSAKTFVGADLAAAVIVGGAFAGKPVKRTGGVLWLAAEGETEIETRIHAAVAARGGDAARPQPFARQAGPVPCLTDKDVAERLKALAAQAAQHLQETFACNLALIGVDTLSAAAGFDDENSAAETQKVMTTIATMARETKALILLIDHYGKIVDTGVRGSSAKSAAADAIIACLGDRDQATGATSNRRAAIAKLRAGPTGRVIPFELQQTTDGLTCTVQWADAEPEPVAPKGKTWPKALSIFKRALDEALDAAGKMTTPRAGIPEVKAVDREAVREQFMRLYVADTAKAKSVAFIRSSKDAVERRIMGSINVGPDLAQTIFWTL